MHTQILQTTSKLSTHIPENKRKAVEIYIASHLAESPHKKFKPCNLYTEHGMVKRVDVMQIYDEMFDPENL